MLKKRKKNTIVCPRERETITPLESHNMRNCLVMYYKSLQTVSNIKNNLSFIVEIINVPAAGNVLLKPKKGCLDIDILDAVIRNAKTSNAVYEVEEKLVAEEGNLQTIRQQQRENLSTLTENRNSNRNPKTTNNHLDKLQEDLI